MWGPWSVAREFDEMEGSMAIMVEPTEAEGVIMEACLRVKAAQKGIPRMSISKFKATAKAGMKLPLIVTADGEDVFAVVDVAFLLGAVGKPGVVANERWLPPDLARDT